MSALEVKTQAEQCTGQVDIWEALDTPCDGCNAEPGEACREWCLSHER